MVGGGLLILTRRCYAYGMLHTEPFALSDFCPFEQVSIAKVLLGIFGAAVVVVLIAVPTAIFLNGESLLLNASHTGVISALPLNTFVRKYFKRVIARSLDRYHLTLL